MATQPEVVSVDELKSLLLLTRERFLDHFDAITPKTVLIKTDNIKTSNVLNGKFFVNYYLFVCVCGIYDSSLLLKPIECSDQIKLYLINLNSDVYIFVYTSVYVYMMSCISHHLNIKNFLIASLSMFGIIVFEQREKHFKVIPLSCFY